MWQDYAIAAVQLVFNAALIPSLRQRAYPPRSTCWLTGAGLASLSIIMLTLDAPFATLSNMVGAALWFYMAKARR